MSSSNMFRLAALGALAVTANAGGIVDPQVDCQTGVLKVFDTYQDELKSLILTPTSANQLCASAEWKADIREAAMVCMMDEDESYANLAPLMFMLYELPCLKSGDNYCWANFGNIVQGPAIALYLAAGAKTNIKDVKVSFDVSKAKLDRICGTDEGKCFTKTTNTIIRRIGQIEAAAKNKGAQAVIRKFQKYTADISTSCVKDDEATPAQCLTRDDRCWCKVKFDGTFRDHDGGIYSDRNSARGDAALPTRRADFCNPDGTIDRCAEAIISRRSAFVEMGYTGEQMAEACCKASTTCGKVPPSVLPTDIPNIPTVVPPLAPTFTSIKADLKIQNVKFANDAEKVMLEAAFKRAVAYAFSRLAFQFTIDSLELVPDSGIMVAFTLKVQDGPKAEETVAQMKEMVKNLMMLIVEGQLVLPNLEVLPSELKISPTAPITVDKAGSTIKTIPAPRPTVLPGGGDTGAGAGGTGGTGAGAGGTGSGNGKPDGELSAAKSLSPATAIHVFASAAAAAVALAAL